MSSIANETHAHELSLQFYDQKAVLSSDSNTYIQLFKQMYSRFETDNDISSSHSHLRLQVQTGLNNRNITPKLILDGETKSLSGIQLDDGFIYESILNTIISRVRSHFLIHAGVVSKNDQGVILVADSAHGKTTLVLELIRRGFEFLSDEMAAIGRKDHMVHPFPRSLRIRPGTLGLTGFQKAAVNAPSWLDKLLLDIESIKENCVGTAVPIRNIVLFQDPALEKSSKNVQQGRKLFVVVDRIEDGFVDRIRKMENIAYMNIHTDRTYPMLEIATSSVTRVLSKIETLCDRYGILLLNYMRKEATRPKFDASPWIETISQTETAREMLKRFLGGHKSALLQREFNGSSLRLFLELADIIQQASCHRLYVGSLSEMADLICGLVNAK